MHPRRGMLCMNSTLRRMARLSYLWIRVHPGSKIVLRRHAPEVVPEIEPLAEKVVAVPVGMQQERPAVEQRTDL